VADWLDEVRTAADAALPPTEGSLTVRGLGDEVEVRRDRWGTPYLDASSLEDLWFAQGFVTASERLFQIELALRAATGRLSEWFAELTVEQDRFSRVIGLHVIGDAEAARWSERSRAMVERFVEGVHAWIASMPAPPVEYALLGTTPDVPRDLGPWASAVAYAAWGLSANWDSELLRVHLAEELGPDAVEMLLPPWPRGSDATIAGGPAGRLLDTLPRSSGQGSNSWVVAGSRTATGKPMLANDPHLLAQQPGAWFEIHLRAPGYEARGAAFPFLPGVLIGATQHLAWGISNVTGDVQDLYEERLAPDGSAAEFEGEWEPLATRPETIAVRGGDDITFEVRSTRHGPLLEAESIGVGGAATLEPIRGAYALRWTATEGLLEPAALVGIVAAPRFDAFRAALRGIACPGQNVVYADVEGTIGYQLTGRYPVRRGGDGTVPVPGWTAEHEWDGWLAFEDLPWSRDPERGFLVTANHQVHDDAYPHLIGRDFHAPFRAQRIAEELATNESTTVDDHAALQVDTISLAARRLVPMLTRFDPRDDDERWALDALSGWDGDLAAHSTEAAVYDAWIVALGHALFEGHDVTHDRYLAWREAFVCAALPAILERREVPSWCPAESLEVLALDALRAALGWLASALGEDRSGWRWGAMHTVRFAHVMARLPGFAPLFVAAQHELGGDEQTVLQAGFDARSGFEPLVVPSYRVVVDLADVDATRAVLPTGESGHPTSPHWRDQAESWISGRVREAPVTRAAVEAHTTRVLTLRPE
jgi:penicillin amidase